MIVAKELMDAYRDMNTNKLIDTQGFSSDPPAAEDGDDTKRRLFGSSKVIPAVEHTEWKKPSVWYIDKGKNIVRNKKKKKIRRNQSKQSDYIFLHKLFASSCFFFFSCSDWITCGPRSRAGTVRARSNESTQLAPDRSATRAQSVPPQKHSPRRIPSYRLLCYEPEWHHSQTHSRIKKRERKVRLDCILTVLRRLIECREWSERDAFHI